MIPAAPADQGLHANRGSLDHVRYSTDMKQIACRTHGRLLLVMTILGWLMSLGGNTAKAQDTLKVVKSFQRLQPSQISFLSSLPSDARFGLDIAALGDLDGDGVPDLAVSAKSDVLVNGAQPNKGVIYILFMNANGTIKSNVKIGNGVQPTKSGSSALSLGDGILLGSRLAYLGVQNGKARLAALAAPEGYGTIYILSLNNTGTLYDWNKFSYNSTTFATNPTFNANNAFTSALENIGDIDNDGINDLAVGAPNANGGGTTRGGIWLLRLNTDGSLKGYSMITGASGWAGSNPFINDDQFGFGCAGLGDLDGDGMEDIAVHSRYQDQMGSIYILFLNTNYTVKSFQKIGKNGAGGLKKTFSAWVGFGFSIDNVGDLNSDGVIDLVAGLRLYDTPATDNGGAMILYLKANGTLQHEEVISNAEGLTSGTLGISGGITFGSSVCNIGDLDGDHVVDIAVGAASTTASGQGNVWLLDLDPKPIVASAAITDQTTTTPGAAVLTVKGGVKPYEYIWADSLPSNATFTSWLNAVDTVGFAALGMPTVNKSSFTYAMYKSLYSPKLDSLKAGKYRLTIIDPHHDSTSIWLKVGYDLKSATQQGVTITDQKNLDKSASSSWTTMEFTSKNLLLSDQDGWLKFTMPALGIKAAVGFRERSATQVNGYQQMKYAYYFSGDSIYMWYNNALHYLGWKYTAGDGFAIERQRTDMLYYYYDKTVNRIPNTDKTLEYVADVAIYPNSGKIENITTDLPSTFTALPTVQHVQALYPASGSVALSIKPQVGTYSYNWSDGNTSSSRTGLAPNRYSVTITSSYYQNSQTLPIDLGNALYWSPGTGYSTTNEGYGSTVRRTSGSAGWSSGLVSLNMAKVYRSHWLSFTPVIDQKDADGIIVGWRNGSTGKVWASWWVHGLGTGILAEALGPSGAVGRQYLRTNDVLGISSPSNQVNYTVNGKVVCTASLSASSDGYNTWISLRSLSSAAFGLSTSMSAPLSINTDYVEPGLTFTATTPDALTSPGTSGTLLDMDLGTGPKTSDHVLSIPATSATDLATIKLALDSGKVKNIRLIKGADTYLLDASLFEVVQPNMLVLYDEAESREDNTPPPFTLVLQDQLLMTPNGDQSYDVFKVQGVSSSVTTYQLTIKDRAANVLYQTADPNATWNGRYMNTGSYADDGVYNYVLTLNGSPFEGQFLLKK